ncbi:DUF4136 domain-containing protein [Lampropedia puyangensis]|uniref:DUF4136 domain-containing protein n=2 Tax=Lampropedia puyangensis TaxID=1330072 RepID=A0A4S8F899_9BURK|nr:DUF4136 domain-containing protein [Lampropedia puyangensis]
MCWLQRSIGVGFCVMALVLTGCASTRVVDNDVRSYSTLQTMPAPPTYRLERLPSQQEDTPYRSMIERLATLALTEVGMQRDDAHGALRLELSAYSSSYLPNWPHYNNLNVGFGYGPWGWNPAFGYYGSWRDLPPTLYVREVRLVLRDAEGKPVFESSARYDDIWTNDEAIYRMLFQSALDGFPTPPQGERRLRHEMLP